MILTLHIQSLLGFQNQRKELWSDWELYRKLYRTSLLSQLLTVTQGNKTAQQGTPWQWPQQGKLLEQVWERGIGLHPTQPARLHSFEEYDVSSKFYNPSSSSAIQASILP